ncbi:MAG: aquaporin [Gemmataceae bacterium]
MREIGAELLGTFLLVFAGTGAIVVNEVHAGAVGHVGVSLTFGLVVLALVYALGDLSGAHLNPAVTLGFVLAGRFPLRRSGGYLVGQCLGALLASLALFLLFWGEETTLGVTRPSGPALRSFVLELLLTFFLMLVVLAVSTGSREKGMMAGVAVGAVIALEALFAGPVCGASMNPARSLGPAMVSGNLAMLWIYLAAPSLGAALAVPIWLGLKGPLGSSSAEPSSAPET